MSSRTSSGNFTAQLLLKLTCCILKKSPEEVKAEYRSAVQVLNCCYPKPDVDELLQCDRIRQKLFEENKINELTSFNHLYQKLQTTSLLKLKACILNFMYCLYGMEFEMSVFQSETVNLRKNELNVLLPSSNLFGSIENTQLSSIDDIDVQVKSDFSMYNKHSTSESLYKKNIVDAVQVNPKDIDSKLLNSESLKKTLMVKALSENLESSTFYCNFANLKLLLKDVLYCVQGLKGNIIQWEPEEGKIDVHFNGNFPKPIRTIVLRFLEQGWLYCEINNYCISQKNENPLGLVAQSFVSSLKQKLVNYRLLITKLESVLNKNSVLDNLQHGSLSLTVHRMSVCMFEAIAELKVLAPLVGACKGKKGGALLSELYAYLQHGDQFVRNLIQSLLQEATRPLFRMISKWIYQGELVDVFEEFFVTINVSESDSNDWNKKYSLNNVMIPSFINMEQAGKILLTGKTINFLREKCEEKTYYRCDDLGSKSMEHLSIESFFYSSEKNVSFESIVEKKYAKTGRTVLRVLIDKYDLMDHLLAMRNYFLLGQGDFAAHLLDLLAGDLNVPGKHLYVPKLTEFIQSAIRATNVQFYKSDILQNLDATFLDVYEDDTGWDVIALNYTVSGPLEYVFNKKCMETYLELFKTFWQVKRIEYTLSKMSHFRTSYLKLEANIPETKPVLYKCCLILAQMVHFVQQMQYYMSFEVVECSWAELLLKISSAKDLHELINAHGTFLQTLKTRSLTDDQCMKTPLKDIFGVIIKFDKLQGEILAYFQSMDQQLSEMKLIMQRNNENRSMKKICFKNYHDLKEALVRKITSTMISLYDMHRSYEKKVQFFLIKLHDKPDTNLHSLSLRLDFNEYFKCKNPILRSSLTVYHRRKSGAM